MNSATIFTINRTGKHRTKSAPRQKRVAQLPARPAIRWIFAALLLSVVAGTMLIGCQSSSKQYALRGHVVAKSPATQQLTISHEDIPGFMPAMTMPYAVKDTQALNDVQPGDVITANVVVQSPDNYWLEHVVITDKSGRGAVSSAAPHQLAPGEKVPDVPLTNQDGKKLLLSQFKGRAVLITFIYTRCPLPNFCPLISSEFSAIHQDLAKDPADYKKTHLISISFDPDYDTPPVLRKYGLAYLLDDASGFQHWDFATTSPEDLRKLAGAFGLEYFQQNNQIAHSMSTVLIAPDGTVAKSWPGNDWKISDVVAAMHQAAAAVN